MAHLGSNLKLLCFERTKTFAEGMKEIGDWLKKEGNTNELIRIYLDVCQWISTNEDIMIIYKSKTW